ncbi:hypothetical protein BVRB_1g009200 [Beta vulgaris subsp. vulgaris]|nr:hypothetical protein BVRB_1g009200 [Beta vulgaris subsp. vulgaris]
MHAYQNQLKLEIQEIQEIERKKNTNNQAFQQPSQPHLDIYYEQKQNPEITNHKVEKSMARSSSSARHHSSLDVFAIFAR